MMAQMFNSERTMYESDEFRMYGFKIMQCPRRRSHDWTQCPFAHRGERARRRDPRRYNYAAVPCPDYSDDRDCIRGNTCQFAHGVFEYWLHPEKYRTRLCNAGEFCTRNVCFFAHSTAELRRHHQNRRRVSAIINEPSLGRRWGEHGEASTWSSILGQPSEGSSNSGNNPDYLGSLMSRLIISGEGNRTTRGAQHRCLQQPDAPDIGWIDDLLD
ncbi:zinc finger CCCH domain-containing protein 54-like [Diospyros lotus]|uniref:zinc finger CCCH domain-containing protein 54-like n=1 Tax=Diospyros lotus TaxID=55363 RepID=UPI00225006B5|nr:zinc finger CCCH domain-containing protein 54-like [Diospyros lotus]